MKGFTARGRGSNQETARQDRRDAAVTAAGDVRTSSLMIVSDS
jgi:hypothetical protein